MFECHSGLGIIMLSGSPEKQGAKGISYCGGWCESDFSFDTCCAEVYVRPRRASKVAQVEDAYYSEDDEEED